jgi:ATP-dependent Clp protease, protease subunit
VISNKNTGAFVKKIDEFNAEDRINLRLLENSVYYLTGEISEDSITPVIRWIMYENLEIKDGKNLTLYINSTGGDLYQAFALIDVIKQSRHMISTVALGACMSAAFLIFASGSKGQRFASKNTSFMCHQFSESMDDKYHDLKATMKENDLCNQRMIDILKEATGLTPSKIKAKLLPASDVYLTSEEAINLGIADKLM